MSTKFIQKTGLLSIIVWHFLSCGILEKENHQLKTIEKARILLYNNHSQEAATLLDGIDTILLDKHDLAIYQLTKSYQYHLKGMEQDAFIYLGNATTYFERFGTTHELAEVNLINGFILETSLLRGEAAKSYMESLKIFKEHNRDLYYKSLLGVIRTCPKGESFIEEAEDYLKRNSSDANTLLLLSAKSDLTKDKHKKLAYQLQSLQYLNDESDFLKRIKVFTNMAKNYQSLGKPDSALYYINISDKIIEGKHIEHNQLLHYYLIKSFIQNSNNDFEGALKSLSVIFDCADDQTGIIGYALAQRSFVYSASGKYQESNADLYKYVEYIRKEYQRNNLHQIGLLNMQLKSKKRELALAKTKIGWLISGGIFAIVLIIGFFQFDKYKKKAEAKEYEIERKLNLMNNRLIEQTEGQIMNMGQDRVSNPDSPSSGSGSLDTKQKFNFIFNIEHPLFKEKLLRKYPNLSNSDIKYCCCFMNSLSLYETSRVVGVTESAVKKARKKLKAVFKISTNEEIGLHLAMIDEEPLKK